MGGGLCEEHHSLGKGMHNQWFEPFSIVLQHFVLEENMLEVDCPCVTPEVVLKASGHVEKFTDLMVKDEKTGTCYRADHLLKDFCNDKLQKDLNITAEKAKELKHVLAMLDDFSAEELGAKIKEYGIVSPDTKNPLSDPYPFNLMFQTSIGPSGLIPGWAFQTHKHIIKTFSVMLVSISMEFCLAHSYFMCYLIFCRYLRPETAQGIFVNFKDLYYYNGNKLPFAAAQIGQAFRNEVINPSLWFRNKIMLDFFRAFTDMVFHYLFFLPI